MKYIYLITFLIFSIQIGFSQPGKRSGRGGDGDRPKIQVKGSVIDQVSNEGLEFATISLFSKRDSTVLGGGLSGPGGVFTFESKMGQMYAEVEFIGYEKTVIDPVPFDREAMRAGNRIIDLGNILLSTSAEALDEVTIRAEKSENQFSLDKRVFNVGKDLANRGGTAEDLLDNVPSVTVDIEGNVELRGSSGVRILINGQPSRLASSANGLKSISADMIESVEVITNPSARYEAEGLAGIINIILKKEKRSGFNGAINSSIAYPLGGSIGANLNYRKNKINWFANYSIGYRSSPGQGLLNQEITRNGITFISEQTR